MDNFGKDSRVQNEPASESGPKTLFGSGAIASLSNTGKSEQRYRANRKALDWPGKVPAWDAPAPVPTALNGRQRLRTLGLRCMNSASSAPSPAPMHPPSGFKSGGETVASIIDQVEERSGESASLNQGAGLCQERPALKLLDMTLSATFLILGAVGRDL